MKRGNVNCSSLNLPHGRMSNLCVFMTVFYRYLTYVSYTVIENIIRILTPVAFNEIATHDIFWGEMGIPEIHIPPPWDDICWWRQYYVCIQFMRLLPRIYIFSQLSRGLTYLFQ